MDSDFSTEREELHRRFVKRFAVASTSSDPKRSVPPTVSQIEEIENQLGAKLPNAYKRFMFTHGIIWTPHLQDALPESTDGGPRAIEEFTPVDVFVEYNRGWEASILTPLVLFASDSLGDLIGFPKHNEAVDDHPVMVFDHEFSEVEQLAGSFDELLSIYLSLASND